MLVVERLMLDGVETATELAIATGLSRRTAGRWMAEVRAGWGEPDRARLNARRDALYEEAQALAATAWDLLRQRPMSPSTAVGTLKVILATMDRRAALLGAPSAP